MWQLVQETTCDLWRVSQVVPEYSCGAQSNILLVANLDLVALPPISIGEMNYSNFLQGGC